MAKTVSVVTEQNGTEINCGTSVAVSFSLHLSEAFSSHRLSLCSAILMQTAVFIEPSINIGVADIRIWPHVFIKHLL